MRTVHWLFVVSVALFLSGLAFVIAGARLARRAPGPAPSDARVVPVATVKQIMNGIVGPAADRLFGAVSYTQTIKGTEEKVPHTTEEWDAVGNDAAAVIESGNLMLMNGRAIDRGDWVRMSQAMIDSGKGLLKAAQARDPAQVMEAGGTLNETCDACHGKYQRGS